MANLTALSKSGLKGKLQKALDDNIRPGEEIVISLNPNVGEGLVVTDSRVMILKAGTTVGAGVFGARCKSFRFGDISSVDLRIGVFGGHLQITVAGSAEVKDLGFMDMPKAENAVTFGQTYKSEMKEIAAHINEQVEATRSRAATPSAPVSIADELRKLADLKMAGALSEEEFSAAKRRLIQ